MTSVQIPGACGLVSGVLSTVGGLTGHLWLVGAGSAVMLAGNLAALLKKDRSG